MISAAVSKRQRRLTRCVYWSMRNRCESPASLNYARYGGRGIRVSDQWSTPDDFIRDMGYKPDGTSLERINVNGHYGPDNCRWASAKEQANNTRRNVFVTAWGVTKTAAEWADLTGVGRSVVANRINRLGWPPELAVIAPAGTRLAGARVMQVALESLPEMLANAGLSGKRKGR